MAIPCNKTAAAIPQGSTMTKVAITDAIVMVAKKVFAPTCLSCLPMANGLKPAKSSDCQVVRASSISCTYMRIPLFESENPTAFVPRSAGARDGLPPTGICCCCVVDTAVEEVDCCCCSCCGSAKTPCPFVAVCTSAR